MEVWQQCFFFPCQAIMSSSKKLIYMNSVAGMVKTGSTRIARPNTDAHRVLMTIRIEGWRINKSVIIIHNRLVIDHAYISTWKGDDTHCNPQIHGSESQVFRNMTCWQCFSKVYRAQKPFMITCWALLVFLSNVKLLQVYDYWLFPQSI